jgi:isopentenyl-diphosphate delta-isomerase
MDSAIHRRLQEELGLNAELEFLFKFQYQTQYDAHGAEHELCWVYAGRSAGRPCANVHEIAAWRYVTQQALQAEITSAPETFTPWFKLEWARILGAHTPVLGTTRTRYNARGSFGWTCVPTTVSSAASGRQASWLEPGQTS